MNWQNLPRRWGRAKRKRERVRLSMTYWREEFRKTLHAAINRIWTDAITKPSPWSSFDPTGGPFVDDALLRELP